MSHQVLLGGWDGRGVWHVWGTAWRGDTT